MNKVSFIACSIITLLSCTKSSTVIIYPVNTNVEISAHTFYAYNLKGDGISDDTQRLQKLLNDSSVIYLKAGIYIINQTLNFKAKTKLVGQKGTIIKAGKNMNGTLLTNGRYIFAEKSDNSTIQNVQFDQSENPYNFKEWANSCIFILDTQNFQVRQCTFNFHLSYGTIGMEAIWISGAFSKGNILSENQIKSLGIRYAENGADSTIVDGNFLEKAYSNALSATGNDPLDFSVGCKVLNNTILEAGRMGIEDWGNTDGTLIDGNTIDGSGYDPKQALDGIAISAVGKNTFVFNNTVKSAKIYAVEVRGNYGVIVRKNKIFSDPSTTGIILNYTFPTPAPNLPKAIVDANSISHALIGVHIFGNYQSNALIESNYFSNSISKSISIESGAEHYVIELRNNRFNFSIPNTQDRFAVFSYTNYQSGVADQKLILNADTIEYLPSASNGVGVDFGAVIRTDNANIDNLQITANGNKNANGVPVNGISSLGAQPVNVIFTNNRVFGALVDLTGFKKFVLTGNSFVR